MWESAVAISLVILLINTAMKAWQSFRAQQAFLRRASRALGRSIRKATHRLQNGLFDAKKAASL